MSHSPVLRPKRVARSSRSHVIAALSLLTLLAAGAFVGACSSDAAGEFCLGGYVPKDDPTKCEGLCNPENCLAGNTCVDNRCVLQCASHADCLADGTQDCLPAVEDKTSAAIFTCQPNDKAFGWGFKCPFGGECDTVKSCKETGALCDMAQCGGKPEECTLDTNYCYGRANCLAGKCHDGSGCTVLTCPVADCVAPLSCLSSGQGDADAYCTKQDCQADAECPGGYYCGVTRDPHGLCSSMNPAKGDNGICGHTNEACIPSSDIGSGNTMFEGQICILRKTCIKRDTCAPCASDLDCSQTPNSLCIKLKDEDQKRCAPTCAKSADCGPSYECLQVEGAPEGVTACHHRFGACVGTGKYCEPCVDDTQCGSLTGSVVCLDASDGSKGCVDLGIYDIACTTNNDCPTSPSGKHAECYQNQASSLYHKCLSFPDATGKGSCW